MERTEFVEVANAALRRLDQVLGDLEHEALDVELSGDVLTLSFADGGKFVINAHSAAGQIWLAAGRTAWHFDYHDASQRWVAAKTGDELMQTVASLVGPRLGIEVAL